MVSAKGHFYRRSFSGNESSVFSPEKESEWSKLVVWMVCVSGDNFQAKSKMEDALQGGDLDVQVPALFTTSLIRWQRIFISTWLAGLGRDLRKCLCLGMQWCWFFISPPLSFLVFQDGWSQDTEERVTAEAAASGIGCLMGNVFQGFGVTEVLSLMYPESVGIKDAELFFHRLFSL